MMNSQQGFDSRDRDIQDFLKTIIEKNKGGSDNKFEGMIKNLPSTGEKVQNFLGGGQMMVTHDYQKDPEIIKNIYEIINNPMYDKDSRTEAQRQLLRINQGLPRFPTV